MLECGRRFADDEFAERTADLRRYNWAPHLGMRGILRLSMFKDVFVLSGCGVGGGSLGYANTLYRARPGFYENPQWSGLADWAAELRAVLRGGRADARRHVSYDRDGVADVLLREYGESIGVGDTYKPHSCGRVPRRARQDRPRSVLRRRGPGAHRLHALRQLHDRLPLRRQEHARQELPVVRGEARRARSIPSARSPTSGRSATAPAPTATRSRTSARAGSCAVSRRTLRARGVIVAAGALGTNRLLQRCKLSGSLPRLSDRLGYTVRTNSEAIISVCAPEGSSYDFSDSVAITSSIYTDPDTHIEVVTYGEGGDSQGLLRQLMVTAGGRGTRPLHFALAVARHPREALGALRIKGTSRRSIILLVMQSLDNSMRLKVKRPAAERRGDADDRAGSAEPQSRTAFPRPTTPPAGSRRGSAAPRTPASPRRCSAFR